MADNSFNANVGSLFQGMEGFILPLVDVSFGVAAGAFAEPGKKENSAGGMGGKIQPSAILVIRNGETKLVNVKNQDSITKVLDMVPDLLDKYVPSKKEKAQKAKN